MLSWLKSEDLEISFGSIPRVCERQKCLLTAKNRLSLEKYPFICKTSLWVRILDEKMSRYYDFTIPKGYCYKPHVVWKSLGYEASCTPALIYDVLKERNDLIKDEKFFCKVIKALLKFSGVNSIGCFLLTKFM